MTTYERSGRTGSRDTDDALDEGSGLRQQAVGATKDVAGTAKEQAGQVVGEASRQARDLAGELKGSLRQQTSSQRERAASGLRTLSDELWEMANRPEKPDETADSRSAAGIASEVARQGAAKAADLASYIETHEPGDLLDEVRSFARRRPGTFLLGAAILGVAVGRLTRGAVAANTGDSDSDPSARAVSARYDDLTTPPSAWPTSVGDEYAVPGTPTVDPRSPGVPQPGYPSPVTGSPVGQDLP